MNKLLTYIKEHKRAVLGIVIAIAIIALITIGLFFAMEALGFTDIAELQNVIGSFGVWSWAIFLLFQIVITTLLCFVPATSMTFAILGNILFNDGTIGGLLTTFIILLIGTTISSQMMFLIGRYGGQAIAIKLVGKEDIEKAQKLLDSKAKVFLPIMYLLTAFPDDALCFVAGLQKMNFWRHLIYVVIFRGLGILTICVLGTNIFDYATFTLLDWFVFITSCAFWLIVIFIVGSKVSKRIEKKGGNVMKYRKKPVVVDAILYDGNNVYDVLCFMNANGEKTPKSIGHNSDNQIMIKTLEGTMLASVGDYIIKGVNGEYYPCKPDIFDKTYEKV